MLKTMFLPAQAVAKLMGGCGSGKRKKGKRRLALSSMKDARDSFLRNPGPPLTRRPPPTLSNSTTRNELQTAPNQRLGFDSTLPIPTGPPPSYLTTNSNSDTDSYILTLAPTPPEIQSQISNPEAFNYLNERLPAPLNLEEAQVYLESLTLGDSSFRHEVTMGHEQVEQLVTVEIENAAMLRNDQVDEDSENSDWDSEDGDEVDRSVVRFQRNYPMSSMPQIALFGQEGNNDNDDSDLRMRRSRTSASLLVANSNKTNDDFHGWRRSSIEVTSYPPVTLAFIPSGLCIGDRIVWVRDDIPEIGTVKWIGKIRNEFYAGVEFDKPVGNSSGIYGYGIGLFKRLFTCKLPYGRFIPVKELILYKDYHDSGIKSGIVCIICRDDFLEKWEPELQNLESETNEDGSLQAFHMVSTKCGHLYHHGCLEEWFKSVKKKEYHCPYCLRPMERTEVIRIFPSQI